MYSPVLVGVLHRPPCIEFSLLYVGTTILLADNALVDARLHSLEPLSPPAHQLARQGRSTILKMIVTL